MKKTLKIAFVFYLFVSGFQNSLIAQSIRKDYREFTNQEMTDYRAALQSMRTAGTFDDLAEHHQDHFDTEIHTRPETDGEFFLPWHRFFALDFEWMLKNTSSTATYLSVPYWDWRTDNSTSPSTFWSNGFLSAANLTGFTFTRDFFGSPALPSAAGITGCLALTPFWISTNEGVTTASDFSHRLEGFHNNPHGWVGGTMGSQGSPGDPVFYLHHNMIDKIWQDWEDVSSGLQSTFTNGTTNMPHYAQTANPLKDSRSIPQPPSSPITSRNWDVWYAFNGKVLLDGTNGTNFVCNDVSNPYTYRYTAATTTGGSAIGGQMFVGDVRRDASDNVVSDTKGGFSIQPGVTVNFRVGNLGSITFLPGFEAKSGCTMGAKTISTPNGLISKPDDGSKILDDETHSEQKQQFSSNEFDMEVFPNPVRGNSTLKFSLSLATEFEISFYNISGKQVLTIPKSVYQAGTNEVTVDFSGLAPGMYFCKANLNGVLQTKKIVVQ